LDLLLEEWYLARAEYGEANKGYDFSAIVRSFPSAEGLVFGSCRGVSFDRDVYTDKFYFLWKPLSFL
jgi:hypothetical protein